MAKIILDYSESLLNLGRIHWYLLIAEQTMTKKRFVQYPPGEIHPAETTKLGKEVQNDEINWWVFKKERDLPSLRKKTDIALNAAQTLKDASKKLSKDLFDSLENLYSTYEKFSLKYQEEISKILEYVQWLHQKDLLAPTIIFNYRTWGSTRMSDRIINVAIKDRNDNNKIKQLTLLVLGLIRRDNVLTYRRVKSDLEYNFYEKLLEKSCNETNETEETIDPKELAISVAYAATYDFAEYFEQIRDSLRNIILDIDKRETLEKLLTSDDFWRNFIKKAAKSQKTEQKYWDFKKTLAMWHIHQRDEKDKKAQKFAELVAGFANNQGGVLVVGVTDQHPRRIVGLNGESDKIEDYMKYTSQVISSHISYEKEFVHFQQVNVPDQNGDLRLCLIIAIQQTAQGLSVMNIDGKSYTYPLREETGLIWKDQMTIFNRKIHIKSDNFDFTEVLRQFLNEEISVMDPKI